MSLLDELVTVNITATTVSPTRQGFGTPLILAYHTAWTDLARSYTGLTGMVADGFAVTAPAYKAAAALLAANPTVKNFYVGRRTLAPLQVLQLTCLSATAGDVYAFTVVGFDGLSHAISVTSTGVVNTDAASIRTALGAPITNIGTVGGSGANVTLTQVSGHLVDIKNWNLNTSKLNLLDNTPDPGIATDLAAVYAAFPSQWYGLILDSNSAAEVEAAAAWTESNKKVFACNNSDYWNATNSTSDLFTALKTSGYTRTLPIYAGSQVLCYSGAAALGVALPQAPGSYTLAYKSLAGVPADNLSATAFNSIVTLPATPAKNANVYTPLASINCLVPGMTPSGEFFDIPIFVDWLTANIQADVFGVMQSALKIPYTDLGVDQIVSAIKTDLKAGVAVGGLVNGTTSVSAPTAASASQTDRNNRNLSAVSFSGRLAGAIQNTTLNGTVSP